MITKGNTETKRQGFSALPFLSSNSLLVYLLKNFLLPYPASPINPEPRRSMIEDSGTAAGNLLPVREISSRKTPSELALISLSNLNWIYNPL